MNQKNPDLVIIYRAYPGISKNPINTTMPKLDSVLTNLSSIKQSSKGSSVYYKIILDKCSSIFRVEIEALLQGSEVDFYEVDYRNGRKTFELQLNLVKELNHSQSCLIIEDDYIMNRECISDLCVSMISSPDSFFTPFYSTDYEEMPFHNYRKEFVEFGGKNWRKVSCTTLTFAAKAGVIMRYSSSFMSYCRGNDDSSMWMSITKKTNFWSAISSDDRWYFFKKYIKLIVYTPWEYLFSKKTYLYAQVESTATHLEGRNCSVNAHEIMKGTEIVRPKIIEN